MNSPVLQQTPRSRSQIGGRRSIIRPPSNLHSDCPPEPEDVVDSAGLGQRSVSLTTLQAPVQPRMAQLETLEAKMASIEVSLSSTPRRKKNGSLGASIRSIPKEIASKELETLRNALRDKENIIQSLKGQLTIPGLRLSSIRNNNNNNNNINNTNNNNNNSGELSDVEKKQAEERLSRLKIDVDNKRLAIKNLKMALERLDITDNIDVRIQQAELEYQLGREELNLLTLLEETRALQLCLDESNKNSAESHTLFNCVKGINGHVILLAVEVEYDVKSPKFGASQKDKGLSIDWALEETGLNKGDRLVEVNGKIVLTKTREDLARLLAVAPDPAQIVILRKSNENMPPNSVLKNPLTGKEVASLRSELEAVRERAEEAQKSKDGLVSDNIRLTHRISYLEEQVSELLCCKAKSENDVKISKNHQNVTNINITSTQNGQKEVQVFQKGPQITTLLDKEHSALPIRSKSSLSNVSNTHISTTSGPQPDYHCHSKSHRHKHHRTSSSRHGLQPSPAQQTIEQLNDKIAYRKHNHHHHHHKDYNSETNSTIDERYKPEKEMINGSLMDQSFKKATKIVHELTRSNNRDNLYEKHRQKCLTASEKYNSDILKHYNARKSTSVMDFRAEIHIGPKYTAESKSTEELLEDDGNKRIFRKMGDARSVKSLDFDSDCNSSSTTTNYRLSNGYTKSVDYTSEPNEGVNRKLSHFSGYYSESIKPRPTPPKKPIRLSLHKTQSLQSVDNQQQMLKNQQDANSRKRNYKGEIPLCKNGDDLSAKWTQFRKDNGIESGSWC